MGNRDIMGAKPWIGGIELELRWLLRAATFNWRVKLYGVIFFAITYICFAGACWSPPNGNINSQ
jgi:hypothetical protein